MKRPGVPLGSGTTCAAALSTPLRTGRRFRLPAIAAVTMATLCCARTGEAAQTVFAEAVRQAVNAAAALPCGSGEWSRVGTELSRALASWDAALSATLPLSDRALQATTAERAARGAALAGRGRFAEAVGFFDAGITLAPGDARLQVLRALTLEAAGQRDLAAVGFARAWQLDEGNAMLAYLAVRRGALADEARRRAHAAMARAYEALRVAPTGPPQPPFPSVMALGDTLVPDLVVGDAVSGPAFALLAAGRVDEGVAALTSDGGTRLGEANPCGARDRVLRGRQHETTGRLADARLDYAAALPATLFGRHRLYVAIGRLAQAEGDFDSAVQSFQHAAQLAPNDATVHMELAAAFQALGRTDDAVAELVVAVLIDPTDAAAHAALGQGLVDAGRFAEAIPALTRALELAPAQFERRYPLAIALARVGRADESTRQLTQFTEAQRLMIEQRRQVIAPTQIGLPGAGGTPAR